MARDASPSPSRTFEPQSYTSLTSGFAQPRKRNVNEPRTTGAGNVPPGSSLGQFSFAPATRTTVVTTTTTTTTNFPPLVLNPPRAVQNLDPKLYPLASSPTPASLRNIKFQLGGQSVIFNEPEDTASALEEVGPPAGETWHRCVNQSFLRRPLTLYIVQGATGGVEGFKRYN